MALLNSVATSHIDRLRGCLSASGERDTAQACNTSALHALRMQADLRTAQADTEELLSAGLLLALERSAYAIWADREGGGGVAVPCSGIAADHSGGDTAARTESQNCQRGRLEGMKILILSKKKQISSTL